MSDESSRIGGSVIRLAAVGRLVVPVSHDIGNPLAALLGRIQVQMARGAGSMPPSSGGLDEMYDHALLISDKVQTLGSLAREAAEGGDPSPCVLTDHVSEITNLLGRHLARRGLELHYAIPPDIPSVSVRPVDLKLCVAGVLMALCHGSRDPAPLCITAELVGDSVRLSLAVAGLDAGVVPIPEELRLLMAAASADGLAVTADTAFIVSMPIASRGRPKTRH